MPAGELRIGLSPREQTVQVEILRSVGHVTGAVQLDAPLTSGAWQSHDMHLLLTWISLLRLKYIAWPRRDHGTMWRYFFEDGFSLPKSVFLGKLPTVAIIVWMNAVVSGHYGIALQGFTSYSEWAVVYMHTRKAFNRQKFVMILTESITEWIQAQYCTLVLSILSPCVTSVWALATILVDGTNVKSHNTQIIKWKPSF